MGVGAVSLTRGQRPADVGGDPARSLTAPIPGSSPSNFLKQAVFRPGSWRGEGEDGPPHYSETENALLSSTSALVVSLRDTFYKV